MRNAHFGKLVALGSITIFQVESDCFQAGIQLDAGETLLPGHFLAELHHLGTGIAAPGIFSYGHLSHFNISLPGCQDQGPDQFPATEQANMYIIHFPAQIFSEQVQTEGFTKYLISEFNFLVVVGSGTGYYCRW